MKIVEAGDPYRGRSTTTAAAVRRARSTGRGSIWRVCYQSRVGPLDWLGPSVEEELRRAGRDRVGVVVAPISFVSEHSETLVELDRDYRHLAERCGVPPIAACRPSAPIRGSSRRWPIWSGWPRRRGTAETPRRAPGERFLVAAYPWIKALHIVAIIAWMAGLLYLPRLFVYHADVPPGSTAPRRSRSWSGGCCAASCCRRSVMTYGFGGLLAAMPGIVDWRQGWIWAKLALVLR